MTNGDRIRAMSNEELADMFYDKCECCIFEPTSKACLGSLCKEGIKAYLESEVE